MVKHKTGTRQEWMAARLKLLAAEKELTHRSDALALQRQQLPWVRVDKQYSFDTEAGRAALADLFQGRSQLLVYHFMFGPDYSAGCPSCSMIADGFDGFAVHLAHHDVTLCAVSRAPLAKLLAYRERMGWRFPWASSSGSAFNFDFGVSFTDDDKAKGRVAYNYETRNYMSPEMPGLSTFVKDKDGAIYHTYSCYARGLDALNAAYQLLDLAPKGRDEDALPFPMTWVRLHDEYGR